MPVANCQLKVHLRHRGLVFWSFFLPVILLLPMTVFAHIVGNGASGLTLVTLLSLAMSAAFFLSSAQREMLSKGLCFLMPGLRGGMMRNQVTMGAGVAVAGLVAAFLVPGLSVVVQGSLAMAWSVACVMVFVYALTLIVVFLFNYSSWLPFQMIWIFSFGVKPMLHLPPEQIGSLLSQPTLVSFAAVVMVFLFWQQIRNKATQRKLAQQPYLSIADLRDPKRLENYKRARDQHKVQKVGGIRPLYGLMQTANRQAAAMRNAGHGARALVWEAVSLSLTSMVPTNRLWFAALLLFFPAFLIFLSYFDSRASLRTDSSLDGWFSGLTFTVLIGVAGLMAYHLRVWTLGRIFGRRDMLRAGWLGAGVMLVVALVVTALLYGLGHLLAGIMPPITLGDRTYFMLGPRAYLLGAPLFILPVQMFVFILWRKPGSAMVLQQSGTLSFFAYHAAFNMGGVAAVWLPAALVTATLWLTLPWIWRWRVLRTDLV